MRYSTEIKKSEIFMYTTAAPLSTFTHYELPIGIPYYVNLKGSEVERFNHFYLYKIQLLL